MGHASAIVLHVTPLKCQHVDMLSKNHTLGGIMPLLFGSVLTSKAALKRGLLNSNIADLCVKGLFF